MSRYRGGPTTTLYIRNISDRVRYENMYEDLRRLFQKYGKIIDVTIPLDYYSGMPKGYCFVEYEDTRDAEEAQYRMDRQRLFGREIEVEFARGDRKTPGEMRVRDPRDPPGEMRVRDPRERDRRGGDFGRGYDAPRRGGEYRGASGRGGPEHERYERGGRSRSRSQHSRTERRGGERGSGRGKAASKTREVSYSRSRSRGSRSYSKNRTPSPKNHHAKSESRDRSRSRDRSASRHRSSSRRNDARSPRIANDMSRSVSPA